MASLVPSFEGRLMQAKSLLHRKCLIFLRMGRFDQIDESGF